VARTLAPRILRIMTAAVGFGRVVWRQVLVVVSCETLTPGPWRVLASLAMFARADDDCWHRLRHVEVCRTWHGGARFHVTCWRE
jgi:hypothetical protein